MDSTIKETRQWIETIVIAHNFCPFVRKVFQQDEIDYQVIQSNDVEERLLALIQTCIMMDHQASIETSLLIYPTHLEDFELFLDFSELAEQLLSHHAYTGIYQLATFHPHYCFASTCADDPANYTNRSPYPMLHLLREQSISDAIDNYPEIEAIPQNNIQTARDIGLEQLKTTLDNCYEKNKPH